MSGVYPPDPRARRLLNIGLRASTLCSKFIFIFFLAKLLDPREVGLYGLLAASVGYGIYLVGLEFYTFSCRELMSSAPQQHPFILRNQLTVYAGWYVAAVLVIAVLAQRGVLPSAYVYWIVALLVSEHLAQELNRILNALSLQLFAGLVLFVRVGLWSLIVVAVLLLHEPARHLDTVLAAWLAGSVAACCLALYRLRHLLLQCPHARSDRGWIRRGLKVALPLFLASVAVRGLATFDRFFIEQAGGLEVVAAYVLYLGVSSGVLSFVDAGVADFAIPKLVATARAGDMTAFRRELAHARKAILAVGGGLIMLSALGGYLLVDALGRAVYIDNLHLFFGVLAFTALNVASLVPHLGLYALGRDRAIVSSQLAGFAVFLLVSALCWPLGPMAVVAGLCSAWLCILMWKTAACRTVLSHLANVEK